MKVLVKVICNCCGKVYYDYTEVCGDCGNETIFTEIYEHIIMEDEAKILIDRLIVKKYKAIKKFCEVC